MTRADMTSKLPDGTGSAASDGAPELSPDSERSGPGISRFNKDQSARLHDKPREEIREQQAYTKAEEKAVMKELQQQAAQHAGERTSDDNGASGTVDSPSGSDD